MKLRIKGNSVRVRLDRRDLDQLRRYGRVEDALRFGLGDANSLIYAIIVGAAESGCPRVEYVPGRIMITIDRGDVEEWHGSDRVGFDHQQQGDGTAVRVILEKDFACLDRPVGEEGDDTWAYPNPANAC